MKERIEEKVVRRILLTNGIADLFIACGMIFLGSFLGATSGLEFFYGGGWGIATLALGFWRVWASRKPEVFWFTALMGIVEGGLLAIYSIFSIFLYSLELKDVIIAIIFGSSFFILYSTAFILKNKK